MTGGLAFSIVVAPLLAAALIALAPACVWAQGSAPELPRVQVDTALPPANGKVIRVPEGGNLREALDRAQWGDVIKLQAGAVYTGTFVLPDKPGQGWITIESSALAKLPPPGTRVTPADSRYMPELVADSGAVIATAPGAHGYRFIGIEIAPASAGEQAASADRHWWSRAAKDVLHPDAKGVFLDALVNLGNDDTSAATLPSHIIFDRCYLHADPVVGGHRGIAMNSAYTAVIDSWLSGFRVVGQDSQAIASWNGSGPFLIRDDFLQAAGENLMFGGADPTIPDLVPSDIEILGNDFSKPRSWQKGSPDYAGTPWSVKNLLELKNARRVLIEGNVLQYNWPQSQNGFGILFTVRNQQGHAPWSAVQDVTFTDNVLRHSANGINILGYDDDHPSQQTQRILISNNLFSDIGYDSGGGRLFQLLDGAADVVITHNTADQSGSIVVASGRPQTGFVFTGNIAPNNRYGIVGTGTAPGRGTLRKYFPGAQVRGNLLIGAQADEYPAGNFFPAASSAVGFANAATGALELTATSRFRQADRGGTMPGVDFAVLCAKLRAFGALRALRVPSCKQPAPSATSVAPRSR